MGTARGTSGIEIRKLYSIEEMQDMIKIHRAGFDAAQSYLIPDHIYLVVSRTGGQVLGAYDTGGNIVGALFALLSREKDTGRLYYTSHFTAVLPEFQGRSIGYSLKCAQREDALANGIDIIKWTFDPMESGNANFNFNKLGVRVVQYKRNYYGTLETGLNAGLPTDRFCVEWKLNNNSRPNLPKKYPQAVFYRQGRPERDESVLCGLPKFVGVSIPVGFQKIKKDDIKMAGRWQVVVREASETLLQAGYTVSGFVVDKNAGFGTYIFSRQVQ